MRQRFRCFVLLSLALGACKGTEAFVATPTTISVSPGSTTFRALGATQQFTATVLDQRGDPIAGAAVVWATNNSAVASTSGNGLVTAAAVGSTKLRATITVNNGSIADSATLTVTQVPAHLTKVSADNQADTVSGTLAPVVVQVSDSLGHPIPGVIVTFLVTAGGGHTSAAADTTDANGRGSVLWTLGSSPGSNTLTATSAVAVPGSPATFSANAVLAGSSPSVTKNNGDGQTQVIGSPVNFPPSVLVADAGHTPLPGIPVTFAITAGSGSLTGATTVTDGNGIATVGSWSLSVGANTLTATVTDTGLVLGNPVTFNETGIAAAYHIDVRFLTTMSAPEAAAFTNAAAKWQSLIIGDVPDLQITPAILPAGSCGTGSPALNEIVDDIVIFAIIDSIDGPGKILGSAGPCLVRTLKHIPIVGVMQFDSADIATLIGAGQLDLVIEHEMGHVLGLGTIWSNSGLLIDPANGDSTQDPHFVGSQTLAAFERVGGTNYVATAKVPVENCCGNGTADGHWRESVFKKELMTGFLNAGVNPLSVVTTASMGDLGYLVNYSASDAFTLTLPLLAGPSPVLSLGNDILHLPIRVVDATGRVVGTIPPR